MLSDNPHRLRDVERWEIAIDLAALDDRAIDRLLGDHLGDDFLEVVPGAFVRGADGLWRWRATDLVPVAIVGDETTFELGRTLADALPAVAVVFERSGELGGERVSWNRNPACGLVPISKRS